MTIGGGSVLFPNADKLLRRNAEKQKEFLGRLVGSIERSDELLQLLVDHSGERVIVGTKIRSATGWTNEHFTKAVEHLRSSGDLMYVDGVCISSNTFRALQKKVLDELEGFHASDRLAQAISIEKLRSGVFRNIPGSIESEVLSSLAAGKKLSVDGEGVRLTGREAQLSDAESKALEAMRKAFLDAELAVPKVDEVLAAASAASGISKDVARKLFQQLLDSGELVRISPDFAFSGKVIGELVEKLRSFAATVADRSIDVPKFKEVAGVSRKYAIPLLEYFDQQKITARRGDKRLVI
nr:Elongation factor SelB, winged helix [uncultured bacterium]